MPHRLDITLRVHRQMLEIVGTALPLISGAKADADLIGLAHLRKEMVATIEAYCEHVHDLRTDASNPKDVEVADTLIAGCSGLQAAYASFRARWAHRDADDSWYEYRLSAVVMMKQVRAQVRHAEHLRVERLERAA